MRFTTSCLLLVSLLCGGTWASAGEPGANDVRQALQERLDDSFEDRLFRVKRTASLETKHHREGDDREWRLVRYRAELRFLRAQRLAGWETLNVGTLVQLLGSTPRGVRGINALGNERGDVLTVEGTLAFALEDRRWLPMASEARITDPEPPPADDLPFDEQLQQRLAEIGLAFDEAEGHGRDALLGADLDQLVADVECRLADQEGLIRLATAAATTEYHALGLGLADQLNESTEQLHLRSTTGSVANVELLHDDVVDAAFAQNDIVHLAYNGLSLFQGKLPMTELRALCALFPEVVHVVTLERGGIESLADLRGAAVDIGPDDSGSRFNAAQVLAVAGLTLADLEQVQGKPPAEALDDLIAGRIHALIMTGVYPYAEIASHVYSVPLKLVSMSPEQVEEVSREAPFLMPMTIPANTYIHQPNPVRTIGVSALLVARDDMPDEMVETLLGALMTRGDALSQHSVQAYYISADTADRGLSVPLHPAAYRYIMGLRGTQESGAE